MATFHCFLWLNSFFIHLSVDGHVGCFLILTIINNAAINTVVPESFWITVFVLFWYIPRTGIKSYGISVFSVWETSIFFSTVAVPIYVPTNSVCKSFLFSTSSPTFVIYVLFDDSCSEGVKWYLIVILICISLMISSAEHLFMCLLAIYISSLAQCLFRYSTYFLIILLGFGFCFDVELYELFINVDY